MVSLKKTFYKLLLVLRTLFSSYFNTKNFPTPTQKKKTLDRDKRGYKKKEKDKRDKGKWEKKKRKRCARNEKEEQQGLVNTCVCNEHLNTPSAQLPSPTSITAQNPPSLFSLLSFLRKKATTLLLQVKRREGPSHRRKLVLLLLGFHLGSLLSLHGPFSKERLFEGEEEEDVRAGSNPSHLSGHMETCTKKIFVRKRKGLEEPKRQELRNP